MKKVIGLVLILVGAGVIAFGGYRALTALGGLYQGSLNDPMNQPEGSEKAASDAMLRGAMIGAVGVPFFLTGYVMWKFSARRARLKA
jgi:hypothetical protein